MDPKLHSSDQRPGVEVNTSLKDIFEPLCHETAAGIRSNIAKGNAARLLGMAQADISLVLPSEIGYAGIPWDIVEDFTETELHAVRSESTSTQTAFGDRVLSTYLAKHPDILADDDQDWATAMLEADIDNLIRGKHGAAIDIAKWKQYEQMLAALSPTARDTLVKAQKTRASNVVKARKENPVIQTTETVLYEHNPSINDNPIINNLVVPIGDYGQTFAHSLIRAAEVIQTFAENHTALSAAAATVGNESTLLDYTARAAANGEATAKTTMETLHEGILSIAQSVAILTTQKVPGYENDPQKLVHDLIASGLVDRLSRYAPMGFVGPMSLAGQYFPGCVVPTAEGRLAFSDEFETFLRERRGQYMAEFVLAPTDPSTGTEPPTHHYTLIGRVCPVSGKGGGIEDLAEVFGLLVDEQA